MMDVAFSARVAADGSPQGHVYYSQSQLPCACLAFHLQLPISRKTK